MGDILKLLRDLGYVPGSSTSQWEVQTESALALFLRTENPPELSSMKGLYQANLDKFRDALTNVVKRNIALASKPTIFVDAPHGGSGNAVTNPSGSRAITSDGTTIKGWDGRTGRQLWSATSPSIVQALAGNFLITDDGKRAISYGNALRVYNADTGAIVRSFWTRTIDKHGNVAQAAKVAARPGTTELVVGEFYQDTIAIYDWAKGGFVTELGRHDNGNWQDGGHRRWYVQHYIMAVAVSPDGRLAVTSGHDFGIRIWDLERRRLVRFINGPSGVIFNKLFFMDDGRTVAALVDSRSLNKTYNNSLYFFGVDGGVLATQRFKDSVYRIATSSDLKTLFVNGELGSAKGLLAFDAQGRLLRTMARGPYFDVIAGENNAGFNIEKGRLAAQTLDRQTLWKTPEAPLGFDQFISGSQTGAAIRLQGQGGEILQFDVATGNVDKTGQLLDAKGKTQSSALVPLAVANRIATQQIDDDEDKREGWIHADTGRLLCQFRSNLKKSDRLYGVADFDYSLAANLVVQLVGETIFLFDATDCKERRRFRLDFATSTRAALEENIGPIFKSLPIGVRFASNGRTLLAWRAEDAVQTIDIETGRRTAIYRTSFDNGTPSAEFAKTIAEARANRLLPLVWDVRPIPNSKRFVVTTGRTFYQKNGIIGATFVFEEGNPRWQNAFVLRDRPESWAIDPSGTRMLAKLGVFGVSSVDLSSGSVLTGVGSESGEVKGVAFSSDGQRALVLAKDGVLRVYDARTGDLLVTTVALTDGTWLSITPEGFFASSPGGERLVRIKMGADDYSIDQFYQSLYRPDLVRLKLVGDPRGLVREAAARLDLTRVLASGDAPAVRLVSPADGTSATGLQIAAEAEITARGGGIGRIEWRLNGVTVGVETSVAPPPAGQPARLTRNLALDAGSNVVEVVAYNSANMIASVPARVTIAAQTPAQAPTPGAALAPRLFVLAVGLNEYADKRFKLTYAVPDAKALAQALVDSGSGLYRSVEIKLMTDAEVTSDKIDAAFKDLAGKITPSDVFVLYLAGHGKTVDGRYYFIPHDFKVDGEITSAAIDAAAKSRGIAQDQWQRWFATVPARRSVVLFDTCESGTLTGDEGETRLLERGAANDRLAQATGRSIITASSGDSEAFEGYRGHGLFTYNVLDALDRGDGDGNGTIEVTELAAYVYARVTEISERVFKQRQTPQMKITANYALIRRTAILNDSTPVAMETKPSYQMAQAALLQIKPGSGETVIRSLSARTTVTVVKSEGGWTLIAKDGNPLGYVATRDLAPLQ